VFQLKASYYNLKTLWESLREAKLYEHSDSLREELKEIEWVLLYVEELHESDVLFCKDRL